MGEGEVSRLEDVVEDVVRSLNSFAELYGSVKVNASAILMSTHKRLLIDHFYYA